MSEPKLDEAAEILTDYREPNSLIDMGNLFFAATEYQRAYDKLKAENGNYRIILLSLVGSYGDYQGLSKLMLIVERAKAALNDEVSK